MKKPSDKTRKSNQGSEVPPFTSNFRHIGDLNSPCDRAIPGVYRITFPVCEVTPEGVRLRLVARMLMTGPLESHAPRKIALDLDVTGTFATVREEFRRLGITVNEPGGLEEACNALLARVDHSYTYRYIDKDAKPGMESVTISEEEAKARLNTLSPAERKFRIDMSLFPSSGEVDEDKWTPAVRKIMSRELTAWATILRCEASALPDKIGYEVKWEAHIDNYLDNPLIHRWTQRVDSLQSYEELRRDLEVLCVDLESYQNIQKACAKALGQNIISTKPLKDIALAKRRLLEHFTEKPHQLPPLHERMARAEAEEYVRQHRLGSFAGNLRVMRFRDEGTPSGCAAKAAVAPPPSPNPNRPMKPLFGNVFELYELVQLPVEPYASDPIARVGTYWLRATHCSLRKRNRFYYTHIRLEMVNEELDPPFRAVYELDRKLTYTQLCAEFRKLQVIIHSKEGLKPACKSVLGDIAWVRCLPEDAPNWMCQNAGMN